MKSILKIAIIILMFDPLSSQAQTQKKIEFVQDLKQEARIQIKRLMDNYDLDDWIFTDVVKIVHGEDARSYPILQMNTDFLTDDEIQLSIFVHENIHIFISDDKKDEAENTVIRKLKQLYPNPPAPKQKNLYHHIMVAWLEYDALIELFDEEKAKEIMNRKIDHFLKGNTESLLYQNYAWYNETAMNNPKKIGSLMVKYGFNINPEQGIIVD